MSDQSLHFNYEYWIERLIEVGMAIEPGKYTEEYKTKIRHAWKRQPLSSLASMVHKRHHELEELNKTA